MGTAKGGRAFKEKFASERETLRKRGIKIRKALTLVLVWWD